MLFRSFLGCGSHDRETVVRRHVRQRPAQQRARSRTAAHWLYLELLEDRIPPGDWLLGAMIGPHLLLPDVFLTAAEPAPADLGVNDDRSADHRPTGGKGFVVRAASAFTQPLPSAPLLFQRAPGEFESHSAPTGLTPFFVDNNSRASLGASPRSLREANDLFASPFVD